VTAPTVLTTDPVELPDPLLDSELPDLDEEEALPERWPVRIAIAVALPVTGAGLMVGGIFEGAVGRVDAVLAGLLGVALAVGLSRVRRPALVNVGWVVGVLLIGLALVVPNGFCDWAAASGKSGLLASQLGIGFDRPSVASSTSWGRSMPQPRAWRTRTSPSPGDLADVGLR